MIAVPIAGGFILVMLVLMAVRLLRTDSQNIRHQLMHLHNERHYQQQQYYQYKQHAVGKAKLYEATLGDDPCMRHLVVGVPSLRHHHSEMDCIVDANIHCLIGGKTPTNVNLDEVGNTLDTPLYIDVGVRTGCQTSPIPGELVKHDQMPDVYRSNSSTTSVITWEERPSEQDPHTPASVV